MVPTNQEGKKDAASHSLFPRASRGSLITCTLKLLEGFSSVFGFHRLLSISAFSAGLRRGREDVDTGADESISE